MVQIFHKSAPGLEGHVPPLKIFEFGQVKFEFIQNLKWTKY